MNTSEHLNSARQHLDQAAEAMTEALDRDELNFKQQLHLNNLCDAARQSAISIRQIIQERDTP